ncbi:MAG: HNH endonuclease [Patescibacteria group bacterium]|nr:HNH endonuclease [Patescibacteria group bacterium]
MDIHDLQSTLGYPIEKQQNGCWIFQGPSRNGFHGSLFYNGVRWQAHRLVYTLINGKIPANKVIRHKCDEGFCVCPAHLQIGMQADNVKDMINRGRARFSCAGHNNGRAILQPADVIYIRATNKSNSELAEELNVNLSVIYKVRTEKTWKGFNDG